MKMKYILLILTFSLFLSSCDVIHLTTTGHNRVSWDYSYYDYNKIHFLYSTQPNYFYRYQYIDEYGVFRYYHRHPYFLRYRRDRARRTNQIKKRPNRINNYRYNTSHKKPRINNTRNTSTKRRSNINTNRTRNNYRNPRANSTNTQRSKIYRRTPVRSSKSTRSRNRQQ